jgi:hypothetical protein
MTKTIQEVARAAQEVRDYIKANGTLPVMITVAGLQVNRATFLRMMSIAIVLIETRNNLTILDAAFNNPPQSDDNVTTGQWLKKSYTSVAYDTNKYMVETENTPTLTATPLGSFRNMEHYRFMQM